MEQNNKNKESKRNPTERSEGADNRCYQQVNQLGITPGPWKIWRNASKYNRCPRVIRSEHTPNIIASFNGLQQIDREVNAYLIAASPDLYEALTEAKRLIIRMRIYMKDNKLDVYHDDVTLNQIQWALDKAAGINVD
jgi:hypothetical protein